MAYGRRYKRSYRKSPRRYRRGSKFSRYNTFRYRSSKAQANQIYSLNKKINSIEQRTKPEIKIFQNAYNFSVSEYCGEVYGGLTTGMMTNVQGRIARLQNISAWFNVWKSPSVAENNFTSTIRVVVFQIRQSMSSSGFPFHAYDIFNISSSEMDNTDQLIRKRAYMRALYGPLKYGISTKVNILRDFKVAISPDRQRASKRIKIKKPITLEKSQNSSEVYPQNGVFYTIIYTSNKATMTQDEVQFQCNVKVAYVDES